MSEICNCRCHEPGQPFLKHFLPCCHKCEACGKNISFIDWKEHKQHCQTPEEKKRDARVKQRQEFEASHEGQKIQRID